MPERSHSKTSQTASLHREIEDKKQSNNRHKMILIHFLWTLYPFIDLLQTFFQGEKTVIFPSVQQMLILLFILEPHPSNIFQDPISFACIVLFTFFIKSNRFHALVFFRKSSSWPNRDAFGKLRSQSGKFPQVPSINRLKQLKDIQPLRNTRLRLLKQTEIDRINHQSPTPKKALNYPIYQNSSHRVQVMGRCGQDPCQLIVSMILNLFQLKFLYINNMCQTLLQAAEAESVSLEAVRAKHVASFFEAKQKMKILSRQTLFLGIAICDKFLKRTKEGSHAVPCLEERRAVRVVACLWVAWKFIETDKIPIKKLLQKVQHTSITSQEVIQMELKILERIDFEIPAETAYAAMTSEFCSLSNDRRSQAVLASQCLKFLQEAIKLSSDFSLCGELGPMIVKLYLERRVQDGRIRMAYLQIQGNKSEAKPDSVKVQ